MVAKPRIIVVSLLNRLGIDWFNGLPIVAFATSPRLRIYQRLFIPARGRSWRAAHFDGTRPQQMSAALLVGGADELFYPDRFAPLFEPVQPIRVTNVPGIGYIGMTVTPAGIAAVQKSFLDLTAPATG